MKKFFAVIVTILVVFSSCDKDLTLLDHLTKNKSIAERISDLNKGMGEIRKSEDRKKLVKEDTDYLEYEYSIDNDNSYVVSFLFDDAGCFEVGMDTYFQNRAETEHTKDQLIEKVNQLSELDKPTITNDLYQWHKIDKSMTIELDAKNINDGMIAFTIFANE